MSSERSRPRQLFVSGLPFHLTNEKLSHYFSSFGQILKFTRPTDRRTGRNASYAFLSYHDVNIFECKKTFKGGALTLKHETINCRRTPKMLLKSKMGFKLFEHTIITVLMGLNLKFASR